MVSPSYLHFLIPRGMLTTYAQSLGVSD